MRTVILAVLMIPGSAWGLGGAITETAGPYVSPSSAAATYVNKAGDTMTGPLGGTVGSFSGSVTASSVTSHGAGEFLGVVKSTANGSVTLTDITQNIANGSFLNSGTKANTRYRPLVMGSFSADNPTKPQAGVWWYNDNNFGTKMFFGTTNSFASGINNSAIAIDWNGSVGIGTASPATKLHMSSGTLTVDGTDATIVFSTFTKTYGSGSAHLCVTDAGLLFASEAACP